MAELPKGLTPIVESPLPKGLTPIVEEDKSFIEKGLDIAGKTVDTFGDLGKGAVRGVVNIPQGIAETVAGGLDLTLGTNTSRAVTEEANSFKEFLGVDDVGTAGKLSEGVVTFGSAAIPIIGWLGRASAVAKGEKVLKGKIGRAHV